MSETTTKNSKGAKASEVHPVKAVQTSGDLAPTAYQPDDDLDRRLARRRVRAKEKELDELDSLDITEQLEESKTRIREFQAKRAELDKQVRASKERADDVELGSTPAPAAVPGLDRGTMMMLLDLPQDKRDKAMDMIAEMQIKVRDPNYALTKMLVESVNKTPAGAVEQADPVKSLDSLLNLLAKLEERLTPPVPESAYPQVPMEAPKSFLDELGDEVKNSLKQKMVDALMGRNVEPVATANEMAADLIWDPKSETWIPRKVTYGQYREIIADHERRTERQAKASLEKQRWKSVEDFILKPVGKRLPHMMDKAEQGLSGGYAKVDGSTMTCVKCGNKIPIPDPEPDELKCGKCGAVYRDEAKRKEKVEPKRPQAPAPPERIRYRSPEHAVEASPDDEAAGEEGQE